MCHSVMTVHTYVPKTTGLNYCSKVEKSLHKFQVLPVRSASNFIQVQSRTAGTREFNYYPLMKSTGSCDIGQICTTAR